MGSILWRETFRAGMMTQVSYNPADFPPGLVAIPAMDWMYTDCANAFVFLPQGFPPGSALRFGREMANPAWNRNKLTEDFLRDAPSHGWEWILYIDSDMLPPPVTVVRLLSHDVDVVGALYYSRREPFIPEFSRFADEPRWEGKKEIRSVDWVGAGCLLVARTVLERMPYPWFEHPNPGEGEDILFSRKVRALGIPVHVDIALSVGHVTPRAITRRVSEDYLASPEGKAGRAIAAPVSERYTETAERVSAEALARATTPNPAA